MTALKRRKEELRKQKDLEQWQATHAPAPLKGILKGSKTNDGGDTPKRILEDSHVHEGERTKRRREAVQVVAAQRHRDSDHFIEYQLRTGVQPLDGEAPSPLLRHEKTLRFAHFEPSPTTTHDGTNDGNGEQATGPPEFPPVFGTEVTRLDSNFIQRKKELRDEYCELPDGRSLCFFVDGDPKGVNVLAFHDGCEGKSRFMQKEPIPGVRLIAIDRPGYGGSDFASASYSFECAVRDVTALTKCLGIWDFVVLGHGVGAAWAQQVAAAMPDRVRGAILWSSMVDPLHPKATGDVRRAQGYSDAVHYKNTGHVGRSPRHFMRGTTTAVAKHDFGVLGLQQEQDQGPISFKKFSSDPFWVSCMVDAWRPNRDRKSILGDVHQILCHKWHYNAEDIKCPVFVFHGDGDRNAKCPAVPDFIQELIPHAQVQIMEGYGHICSFGPDLDTRSRIEKAVSKMPALPRPDMPRSQVWKKSWPPLYGD